MTHVYSQGYLLDTNFEAFLAVREVSAGAVSFYSPVLSWLSFSDKVLWTNRKFNKQDYLMDERKKTTARCRGVLLSFLPIEKSFHNKQKLSKNFNLKISQERSFSC